MKSKNLLIALAFIFINVLLLSGCKNKLEEVKKRVYLYQDTTLTLTAGLDKDTLYYIMKDQGPPRFHKTPYKSKKINDSTFVIEVTNKPKFWDKNTWEIIVRNENEFVSAESGKVYKIYNITFDELKKAF